MNLDQLVPILIALAIVSGGIGIIFWWIGKSRSREIVQQQESEAWREYLETDATETEILLALVDGQDKLLAQQQKQTCHLGTISSVAQLVAILVVLATIAWCAVTLFGASLSLP